jgi:hypothetical protein
MLEDFSVRLELRDDRLCPPLPNRLNYICWLCEVITCGIDPAGFHPSTHVLDIGVGASCIYPLLGHKLFGWKFTGSDIDPESLSWSRNIIDSNSLSSEIRLVQVGSSDKVQGALEAWCGSAMCQGSRQRREDKRDENTARRVSHCDEDMGVTVNGDCMEGDGLDMNVLRTEQEGLEELDEPYEHVTFEHNHPDDANDLHTDAYSDIMATVLRSHSYCSGSSQCVECVSLRGPVRVALVSMGGEYQRAVEKAECAALHGDKGSGCAEEEKRGPSGSGSGSSEMVLTACMTNPPFFTPEEQVGSLSISYHTKPYQTIPYHTTSCMHMHRHRGTSYHYSWLLSLTFDIPISSVPDPLSSRLVQAGSSARVRLALARSQR